jgi:hypothetical protein
MVAIVDRHVQHRIDIRAAAAAGLSARLVHNDAPAFLREARGGGEAGQAGADNMNLGHEM